MRSLFFVALASCGYEAADVAPMAPAVDADMMELTIGTEPEVCDSVCRARRTDIFKSFVVIDPEILARFPLRRVLDQLATMSGTASTADSIWRQWWSSQRERTGGDPASWPFCDDNGSTINGFPIECPRAESDLAAIPVESHTPVALFNRFDLAPTNGAHCGEYRIVYAKTDGLSGGGTDTGYPGIGVDPVNPTDPTTPRDTVDPVTGAPRPFLPPDPTVGGRNFIIFEGVLPNPHPECGPAACLEVAQFWQALSSEPNVTTRADRLEEFYFRGICGYEPVVKPEHYGLNCRDGSGYGGACGQIRTNQFVQRPWNLREYTLRTDTTTMTGGELLVQQTTVAQNPHFSLFDSTHPMFPGFKPDFLNQMTRQLPIPDDVNNIGGATSPRFDAGESISQAGPGDNDYLPDPSFMLSISGQLAALGMPATVTPGDEAERATTQSCGGCHELSNFDDLGTTNGSGPSTLWPPSLGFVHVDEASNLSPALLTEFLPHRQNIMAQFLLATCGTRCIPRGGALVRDEDAAGNVFFDVKTKRQIQRQQISIPAIQTMGGRLVH